MNLEWNFVFLNKEAEQILGSAKEELIGNSIWDEYSEPLEYKKYHYAMAEQCAIN